VQDSNGDGDGYGVKEYQADGCGPRGVAGGGESHGYGKRVTDMMRDSNG
jgi:hypothetical protein